MKPSLFVMIPSYNHAAFIERCIDSIGEQTLKPDRLLVIDDGSSDGSPEIIRRALARCQFPTELIARENRGLCKTLNEGLARASERYFAYVGSDDYWMPTFLERRVQCLESRPAAVLAYGHAFYADSAGALFSSTAGKSWGIYPDGDPRDMLLGGRSPVSSTVMYRREALNGLQWNERVKLEDYDMYLQLSTRGEFAFDDAVLSVWREHATNASKNLDFMMREVFAALDRHATVLGMTDAELAGRKQRLKFAYAQEYLQIGEKGAAFRLARDSWKTAQSVDDLFRFSLRLLAPKRLLKARHSRRMLRTVETT